MRATDFSTVSMLAIPVGVAVYTVISKNKEDSDSMPLLLMLTNFQIPLPAVVLMVVLSFILGYLGALSDSASFENEYQPSQHVKIGSDFSVDSALKRSLIVDHTKGQNKHRHQQDDEQAKPPTMSTARYILHHLGYTGKHVQKVKDYTNQLHLNDKLLLNRLNPKLTTDKLWSNLSHEIEGRLKPTKIKFSSSFMGHLLTYNDFTKLAAPPAASSASTSLVDEEFRSTTSQSTLIRTVKDTKIGHVILKNAHETSFDEEGFAYIVEPMCTLRGMDMFLTDVPEVEIWKQPLLIECGLTKAPTLVCNLMLPFGNMTVYLKLPKWFDDWDNIPEEKDDDTPDIKAFKRFLKGDDEYRNKHTKLVPYIVDGPMAIRMIKPKPQEFSIHGVRHPVTWHKVRKTKDSTTSCLSSALLECDIDVVSNPTIRKIVSMVRPHMSKITIDLALIVSKPKDSEVEEPSACIGMWRVDKVDFETCAVLPQKSVEEVAQEVKSYIALEEQD